MEELARAAMASPEGFGSSPILPHSRDHRLETSPQVQVGRGSEVAAHAQGKPRVAEPPRWNEPPTIATVAGADRSAPAPAKVAQPLAANPPALTRPPPLQSAPVSGGAPPHRRAIACSADPPPSSARTARPSTPLAARHCHGARVTGSASLNGPSERPSRPEPGSLPPPGPVLCY